MWVSIANGCRVWMSGPRLDLLSDMKQGDILRNYSTPGFESDFYLRRKDGRSTDIDRRIARALVRGGLIEKQNDGSYEISNIANAALNAVNKSQS